MLIIIIIIISAD